VRLVTEPDGSFDAQSVAVTAAATRHLLGADTPFGATASSTVSVTFSWDAWRMSVRNRE
jgi:hypothetical protein